MTKRRRVRVPARKVAAPAPEPVVEEVAEDNNGDYTEWSVADLRAECVERNLDTTGRKSTLVKRLLADDEGVPEEVPAKPAPKIKRPAVKKPATKKPATKKAVEKRPAVPELDAEIELATGTLATIFDAMTPGVVYGISRIDEDTWQFTIVDGISAAAAPVAAAAPKGKGLRGEAFWKEVLTPEYHTFFNVDAGAGKAWNDMTVEEKYAFAEAQGIEWQEAEDDKVDMMRLVQSAMKGYGIVKYKDEYKSKAQRDALK